MANTLEQFKENMDWSMIELDDSTLEDIYNSVDKEEFTSLEDVFKEYDYDTYTLYHDTNLHSVIEAFEHIIEKDLDLFHYVVGLYYLKEDDVYIGILH